MTSVEQVDWPMARAALNEAAGRVAGLLRSGIDPAAPALGRWDVAELATHLSHAFDVVPALARQARTSPLTELWELGEITTGLVADDPERDLDALAGRIETRAAEFLRATAEGAATDPCPWLVQGSVLPLSVLTCHLLNEAVLHAYDIATAVGRQWSVDRAHAALIFQGFLLPVFQALDPRALVLQDRAAGVRAVYDIRLRGGVRFVLVFDDGAMTVEGPARPRRAGGGASSARKVDCHLSVDPSAFVLVAWGRINQWHAIPRGQLVAWGRRPRLGLQLRGLLRNP